MAKDVKEIKLTAREANKIFCKSGKRELEKAYEKIRKATEMGSLSIDLIINGVENADYVFENLVRDGYTGTEQALNSYFDDHRMVLTIDWSKIESPDKRYILLMDDTRNKFGQVCATLHHGKKSDSWTFKYVNNMAEAINFDYTVTAKDLEEAPDWVKAIEPVEVDQE